VSLQDTEERIFINGQIYSRPRFGGPVGAPDNRRFTPDPNPYNIEPEPRGYGQGSVVVPDLRDLLFRPTDTFDISNPVYRPEDKVELQPLEVAPNPETGKRDFLYQYLEQNQEVMGPKTQMFNRFANPDDGTLNNEETEQFMAGAPRRIRGKFAPPGAIIKDPHVDSSYYVEPRFFPTTPPPGRGAGPQLPGFV